MLLVHGCVVVIVCWIALPVSGGEWHAFGNSMYKVGEEYVSWQTAQDNCACQDAILAEVNSDCENKHLRNLARDFATDMYIGGRKSDGVWRWASTNETFTTDNGRWGDGEPNGSGDCAQLYRGVDFKWDDTTCVDTNNYYICEKPKP